MNGISNRLPANVEVQQNTAAIENFEKRIIETGKIPGTHSLGAEFRTSIMAPGFGYKNLPSLDLIGEPAFSMRTGLGESFDD